MPSLSFDQAGDNDCSWCGAELGVRGARIYRNRAKEEFCSRYHRGASNEAVSKLVNLEKKG